MKLRKELAEKLRYAVEHSPMSASYKGRFTQEEYDEIIKRGFEIYVLSIFMNGTADYMIRWYNH